MLALNDINNAASILYLISVPYAYALHVIHLMFCLRFLSRMSSHDVASMNHLALAPGRDVGVRAQAAGRVPAADRAAPQRDPHRHPPQGGGGRHTRPQGTALLRSSPSAPV